jgi:hypothetical protein
VSAFWNKTCKIKAEGIRCQGILKDSFVKDIFQKLFAQSSFLSLKGKECHLTVFAYFRAMDTYLAFMEDCFVK